VIATTVGDIGLLVGAGALAGAVGSAGGTASLVSYPALLAVGLPAFQANVTNAVAFVASLPGSAAASRGELRGRGRWLRSWAPLVATGGAAGAALLLLTPTAVFNRVVPFLVAAAALALLLQRRISRWQETRSETRRDRLLLPCGLLLTAIYNGYWGAGSGVMILVVLLLAVDQHLPRANALKNVLLGVADVVAAVAFTVFGPVDWRAAAPLAIGLLVGSMLGPSITRRVPERVIRTLVGMAGLALALKLWIAPS
jgi:uncharacterized protein